MIEILWKQDIDIGIPRDHFLLPSEQEEQPNEQEDADEELLKEKLNASSKVYSIDSYFIFLLLFPNSVFYNCFKRRKQRRKQVFAWGFWMDYRHKTLNFTFPFLIIQNRVDKLRIRRNMTKRKMTKNPSKMHQQIQMTILGLASHTASTMRQVILNIFFLFLSK